MSEAPTPASRELFAFEDPGENGASPAEGETGRPPQPPQDPGRSPNTNWPVWTAFIALIGGLVLTTLLTLLVDIPAAALGAKITGSHTPPGLTIADTFVQDVCFVVVSIWCAQLGNRKVASWQFGLRRPPAGWWRAAGLVGLLLLTFILLSVIWSSAVNPSKEKLLEQLGTNEGTALLVLSAALTCVMAPMCEEFLFRGYIFTALRNWRGTLPAAVLTGLIFGGVHAGSAPALDLVPLAALGFGLCLLYRYTGSLYPSIAAHSLNNTLAFASLEGWGWQTLPLMVGSLATIALVVRGFRAAGVIEQH